MEVLSNYLADIISSSASSHLPKLSHALQSVIAPAISKEIANNQEVMVDALYPIMGGMISKYVSSAIKEMMDSINHKIEEGLSFERYKRKLKARFTGVSESELLLKESHDTIISSLFVIHKESGLLIAESHIEDQEIDDPHMVASMASAIRDFINDWIQEHKSDSEVQILSYGSATLYIESAGSVYIIAFLDSEPNLELRSDINLFFALIVKRYALFFQSFDGDDSAEEIKVLSKRMYNYLHKQKSLQKPKVETTDLEEKKSLNHMRYILWVVGVAIIVVYMGYLSSRWLEIYTLEQRVESEYAQRVSISTSDDRVTLDGYVDSAKVARDIEMLVATHLHRDVVNRLQITPQNIERMIERTISKYRSDTQKEITKIDRATKSQIDKNQNSTIALKNRVAELQESLNTLKSELIESKKASKESIKQLSKQRDNLRQVVDIESKIYSELEERLRDNPYYLKREQILDFRNLNLFSANKTDYNPNMIDELKSSFDQYISVLQHYREYIDKIVIEGHTDSSGKEEKNIEISTKRANIIKHYLLKHSSIESLHLDKLLHSRGMGAEDTIIVGNIEDKAASRRIRIKFYIKDSSISENIKKILND